MSLLYAPAGRAYMRASRALLDRVLDWRPGWRVLDVGCGLGGLLAHLMDRGGTATGLEAGPVRARLAAQRLGSKAEVDLGDAHDLPYEDNDFDAVILVNTLELLDRPAQVLGEAVRVAASRVCVVSRNALSPSGLFRRWFPSRHPLNQGRPFSLLSLRRLVREVLGPVPQTWAGAALWPGAAVGRWPLASLIGVCGAVTPRFVTRPLKAPIRPPSVSSQPAHSHGRVGLELIK